MKNVLVTGGAGFIGSHLVDLLMEEGQRVTALDNLSAGSFDNIARWSGNPLFSFERLDLLSQVKRGPLKNRDVVFHLAANPDVRSGTSNPKIHFDQNIQATHNVLEEIRKTDPTTLIFASSSTVYGEADRIPTPEEYGPLKPTSVYGGSKLACESLVIAYAKSYGFKAAIYRLANVMGARSNHGVVFDLVRKLSLNREILSMYGNGTQDKSYVHVSDCVRGLNGGINTSSNDCETFNLGSEDRISVKKIADIVCQEMGLTNVKYDFHCETSDGRGWPGDVKTMQLDISKLKRLGWNPTMNSEECVRRTVRELTGDHQLVFVPRKR